MYTQYVAALAQHASIIFEEMTGTKIQNTKVKRDERATGGDTVPLAVLISYEHLEQDVTGEFVLGFETKTMAMAVATALAENMGLPPVEDLDEVAIDLLNEFMNTVVGRTISEWDRMGLPVTFSPPSALMPHKMADTEKNQVEAYVIDFELAFSHVMLRINFSQPKDEKATPERILVVDDSSVIRTLIAKTLEQAGYEVKQAGDGLRAQEVHKAFKPDLTIMDLVMPQMGGMEAMKAIRQQDETAHFIVLTSSARRDEVIMARDIGVKAYLIKPFKPDALLAQVKKTFDER